MAGNRGFPTMVCARFAILLIALLIPSLTSAQDINQELIEAAKKGNTTAVKALLEAGADVNTKDKKGWTGLLLAAVKGHTATVQALLDAGADVNAKAIGVTALSLATRNGHTAVVQLLKKAGAKR